MKRTISTLAFLSSLVSLVVVCGAGLTLVAVQNSGERATGALFAFCGAIAFIAVMFLIFAGERRFREQTWRAGALGAAIIGALPVAGLAIAAMRFAGLPVGSAIPGVDWSIFVAGLALAAGALSILALGYRRARQTTPAGATEVIRTQQIQDAQLQLRTALRSAREAEDADVRVHQV